LASAGRKICAEDGLSGGKIRGVTERFPGLKALKNKAQGKHSAALGSAVEISIALKGRHSFYH